jgi:sugar transferase (PEP-CTERM/EpsH1 system associated)
VLRIVFVTVRLPFPLNSGGRIRTFHLLKHVSQVHRVTLVTALETREEARAASALQEQLPQVTFRLTEVPPRGTPVRRAVRALRSPIDTLPYTWAAYRHPRFIENLRRALSEESHQLLHCDHTQIAHAVLALRTPPRLLNAHNVDSLLLERLAGVEPRRWKRALIRWQARKVRAAERRTYPAFDGCLAMSEVDHAHIEHLTLGRPVWTIPNGVDIEWFEPVPTEAEPDLLAFSGAMDWVPNVDAVEFFAGEILPRIRRRRPGARLLVVGRDPSPALVARFGGAGVEFTGTVEDVRPHLARCRLFVVPLRVGSGTRLKILEAWAMGKAVLSTALGAEGLPARDGENIVIGDTPERFAERAVALLEDAGSLKRLGGAGRQVVEETFSWKRIGDRLLEAYEATLAGGRRSTT